MTYYQSFFDHEIKFDLQKKLLDLCAGEVEFQSQDYIEDYKGNQHERGCFIYQQTIPYRELKRGTIVQDKSLLLLNGENVVSKYSNVYNIGSEQGIFGQLYLTNVRLAWFAEKNESLNISIPWILIKNLLKKQLKVGLSLVVEINEFSGGYSIGYYSDQIETLFQEVEKLRNYYILNPDLGIKKINEDYEQSYKSKTIKKQLKMLKQLIHYLMKKIKNEIDFDYRLGVAIEKLPNGIQTDDLWQIINKQSM
ncbi:hypothetical protein IMG5_167300 [Ichthyophthirius multifiliis]|uniref:BBSome complex member BBS5 PH domain-containing protein n=1 Tax=Ichthyophthirius multifiliis TaxID=5932 RepID=G0R0W6_ICHMU|nr:hypothetical protein IMG5_167300 [Ichthyophthirius multifiliis]EGR28877.1 hypothetical protein IMG5_167300 [Ichthyophthirius multifiliis]|eukprot:XP_004030113.1 hypothetical protein IMG5_167300 [Ichthyophthirius multifiliis]